MKQSRMPHIRNFLARLGLSLRIEPALRGEETPWRLPILIIALGLFVRFFCFHYTYIINPDGALYIHQARTIYYGMGDAPWNSVLGYLSNYPIFIAVTYAIVGDWVIAAKVVSLIFGTIMLIPMYLLCRRLFDEKIALLVTFVFAFIPFLVDRSVDVVRAPVFWFFLVLGMHFFVGQIGETKHLYLLLSNLSFLFAAWARIEGVLFVGISYLFMLIIKQERKLGKLAAFSIPIVPLIFIYFVRLPILNLRIDDLFYFSRVVPHQFTTIADQYQSIRGATNDLVNQGQQIIVNRFLLVTRRLVWWIAIGTLLTGMIKAFFYPFFIVFLMGFKGIWRKLKENGRILYLSILSLSAMLLLCIAVLYFWEMPTRYMGVLVLPSAVFIGLGMERIMLFLRSKFNLKESIAFFIICLLILGFALPKNLKSREKDKVVFKEIGGLIAQREGNQNEIVIVASIHSFGLVSFYANVEYKGAPRPRRNWDLESLVGLNYGEFVKNLRHREVRYFLWEEKHWPKESMSHLKGLDSGDLIQIGTWSHPDTGKLILFKVI